MKICYLSIASSVHTQRWARYFAERGNEVYIISDDNQKVKIPNVVVESIPDRVPIPLLRFIYHVFWLRKMIKKIDPDILHVHWLRAGGWLLAFMRFKPLIVSSWGKDVVIDEPEEKSFSGELFKKYILKKADIVTATSEFLTKETAKYAPRGKEIFTVPFGVDTEKLSPRLKKESDVVTVGIIKRLEPKYGPEYLIKAIPSVLKKLSNLKVLIVGDGSQRDYLSELAEKLGISKITKFVGQIPNEEVPDYLAKMDIFVMPSIYSSEVFGVAAVEAQAMEVPVIATKVGGIPEVVIDGETGILVNPRESEEIADAIVKLVENRGLRQAMGKRGRGLVAEKYDWHQNAKSMEEIYRFALLKFK